MLKYQISYLLNRQYDHHVVKSNCLLAGEKAGIKRIGAKISLNGLEFVRNKTTRAGRKSL